MVQVRIEAAGKSEGSLTARLAELTDDGRSEAEREKEYRGILLAWEAAGASLEEIDAKLAECGDDPGAAVTTLEKQLQAADDAATKALEQEKNEEGRLMHAATQGPYSALAQAEEELARLQREITSEEFAAGCDSPAADNGGRVSKRGTRCSGGSSGSRRNAYAAAHRW